MILSSPRKTESLNEFCARAYANHDNAHNDQHGKDVFWNANAIITLEKIKLTPQEKKELPTVMRLHDALDHKAITNGVAVLSAEEIKAFYVNTLGAESAERISHIHENCSWSKRKTSQPTPGGDMLRLILQDADWLEAMGHIGITRCTDYTRQYNPNDSPDQIKEKVCQHIREKLLHIPDELNFTASRKLVTERNLIEPMLEYLDLYEKK